MVPSELALIASLLVRTPTASTTQRPSPCLDVLSRGTTPAVVEVCRGEEEYALAQKAPADSPERRARLTSAADRFRRATTLSPTTPVQVQALEVLARIYDASHLNDAGEAETVLAELVSLVPEDLRYRYRLAQIQENQERFDAAEHTLLAARDTQPEHAESSRRLAQFFARRALALQPAPAPRVDPSQLPPGPDEKGVYPIRGAMQPPQRKDVAQYPVDAQVAGVEGVVQAEITINEQGTVTDATIVRSVPLLDESALKAVREWRYDPVLLNGRAIPVKMVVNVRFTLSK
jgi:TonB family protein